MRGHAWGCAFTARMCRDHPSRSEEAREAYEWAEKEFLKLAMHFFTDDEAIEGYGG